MKRPGLMRREAQVRASVPDLFTAPAGQTLLYIGARRSRMQLVDIFHEAGYVIDVVEIYGPNVEALKEINRERRWFREILQGDVRQAFIWDVGPYDVVVWWHGPEHVVEGALPAIIEMLKKLTKGVLLLGCPFGHVEQGVAYGNTNEIHAAYLYPHHFKALGFESATIGPADKGGSHITSWWRRPI